MSDIVHYNEFNNGPE